MTADGHLEAPNVQRLVGMTDLSVSVDAVVSTRVRKHANGSRPFDPQCGDLRMC